MNKYTVSLTFINDCNSDHRILIPIIIIIDRIIANYKIT